MSGFRRLLHFVDLSTQATTFSSHAHTPFFISKVFRATECPNIQTPCCRAFCLWRFAVGPMRSLRGVWLTSDATGCGWHSDAGLRDIVFFGTHMMQMKGL